MIENNNINDDEEEQKLIQDIQNVEHFLIKLKIRLEGRRLRRMDKANETTIPLQ